MFESKPENLPTDTEAFAMPDGTYVAVVASEPLPDTVLPVVQASIDERVPVAEQSAIGQSNSIQGAEGAAGHALFWTGKKVIVIFPGQSGCGSPDDWRQRWAHTPVTGAADDYSATRCGFFDTPELAVADAEQRIASQPQPSLYQIVYAN